MSKQTKREKSKSPQQAKKKEFHPHDKERDIVLSRRDASGGGPADVSVGGEEDAGVGLEFLVRKERESR